MIPIFWRFLLREYIKTLFLSCGAFLAILMTMRFSDIAQIAALGASWQQTACFVWNQIPYILPIALPISCLLSSILLTSRLSKSCEITAFRSLGLSLTTLTLPLLVAALFLSILNAWIVSEWATNAHLSSNQLRTELRTINPLLLAQSNYLTGMRGIYFQSMGKTVRGKSATDVVAAFPGERIHLFLAKELRAKENSFDGDKLTFITSQNISNTSGLLIENISHANIPVREFANVLHRHVWGVKDDYLNLPLLLARRADLKEQIQASDEIKLPSLKTKYLKTSSELFRRLSLGFAPISFTLMGVAFGVTISRRHSKKGLIFVMILAGAYLFCFFFAKSINHKPFTARALYLVPHAIIISLSLLMLSRTTRGIE